MAKLQPDGSLSGSLGGATYAKQPDGTVNVRSKGGATRDKVMKSPGMARTRENFHDFGRASGSAKVIRLCLREMIKGHKLADPILSGRFNSTCTRILRSDPENVRGARVMWKGDMRLLKEFEFFTEKDNAFQKVFGAAVTCDVDTSIGILRLHIEAFDPLKQLRIPANATHFRILFNGASVNFEKRQFDCRDEETDYMPLHAGMLRRITLSHDMPAAAGRFLIATMGIVFYRALEHGGYERVDGGVMKIVEVKQATADSGQQQGNVDANKVGPAVSLLKTTVDAVCMDALFAGLKRVKQQRHCTTCMLPDLLQQAMHHREEKTIDSKPSPLPIQQGDSCLTSTTSEHLSDIQHELPKSIAPHYPKKFRECFCITACSIHSPLDFECCPSAGQTI